MTDRLAEIAQRMEAIKRLPGIYGEGIDDLEWMLSEVSRLQERLVAAVGVIEGFPETVAELERALSEVSRLQQENAELKRQVSEWMHGADPVTAKLVEANKRQAVELSALRSAPSQEIDVVGYGVKEQESARPSGIPTEPSEAALRAAISVYCHEMCRTENMEGCAGCRSLFLGYLRAAYRVDASAAPRIAAHELRVSAFGFRVVEDPTLPVSAFRLLNANGGYVEYDAESGKFTRFGPQEDK